MNKREKFLIVAGVFGFIFMLFLASASDILEVGSLLIKVNMYPGQSNILKEFSIQSMNGGRFEAKVDNVPNLNLTRTKIALRPGEKINLGANFSSFNLAEGVYVGNIQISGEGAQEKIPVIFEVESKDLFFDANVDIPDHYSEVPSGSKLVVDVKIFDLVSGKTKHGLGPTPIVLEYKVLSIDGTPLSSESESIVIDKEATITKTLSFPKTVNEGNYVFAVVVKYQNSVATSTNIFRIVKPTSETVSFLKTLDWSFILILGVIVIFFFGLLFVFLYLIRDRDKLFLELRKYNDLELERQEALLKTQEEIAKEKEPEKHEIIKKEIEKKVINLKKKQEKRINEFKDLKKKGDVDAMKKRLAMWKKEGYNTMLLESKLGMLSNKDMDGLMKKWKKQYR